MKSIELIRKYLKIGSSVEVPKENPFLNTEDNVNDLNKDFDDVLRMNIITKDNVKAQILVYLFYSIRAKSQYPEYLSPKTMMKAKAKSIESFADDLSGTYFDNLSKEIKKLYEQNLY